MFSMAFIFTRASERFASVRLVYSVCWLLLIFLLLYRWLRFICPNCHQYFFLPVMHRPTLFVSHPFARRCCNCGAEA